MKNPKARRANASGVDKVMLDLFMGLTAYLLAHSLDAEIAPADLVVETDDPPVVEESGNRPRAGREAMTISVSPNDGGAVEFQGESWNFSGAKSLRIDGSGSMPDMLSIRFVDNTPWSEALAEAVERGVPISIEFE